MEIEKMKAASWVLLLLGIWLLASPMVLHVDTVLARSNLAAAILVILAALWGLASRPERHASGWIALLIGLWVFMSPYALAVVEGAVPLANNGIVGALLMVFAVLRTLNEATPTRYPAA
jgi:hypothetical protein